MDNKWKQWVEEGRKRVERAEKDGWWFGEMAHQICEDKNYGEGKLEQYAEEIGLPYFTLKNCRTVYRAWHIKAPDDQKGRHRPFSICQDLVAHPQLRLASSLDGVHRARLPTHA
jgi:hypothetical protein